MNDGNPLRHLAFVADEIAAGSPGPAAATEAAFRVACRAAKAAAGAAPRLEALSFFSPEIRGWLLGSGRDAVLAACARGLRGLAAAAAEIGAALRVTGRADRLPAELLAHRAPPGATRTVAWFLDYGAREEIARAATRYALLHPGEALTEAGLSASLDTAGIPDPDLILYAGGPFEPKDFLLWQGSYAEYWHTPRPWPEFTDDDLAAAIGDYLTRQRRFGR